VNKLNEDERAKLAKLGDGLRQRIFGQDVLYRSRRKRNQGCPLRPPQQGQPPRLPVPRPSGVGKTECAKAVAAMLLDDERALTRFDMSEYMEKHAVAKMIGAPPGYEGFDVGGILTNAMRKEPEPRPALRRDREGASRRLQHLLADSCLTAASPTTSVAPYRLRMPSSS